MAQVKVCVCRDGMEAHFLRAVLEGEGIRARIAGESLGMLAGSVPYTAAMPELWVEAADAAKAAEALASAQATRWQGAAAGEWVCPNCGEAIEAQFTDCWKCQTARPAADVSSTPTAAADREPLVDADVRCHGCGYNLRGIPATHRCPECGRAILQSLTAAWRGADEPVRRMIREVMRYVAGRLGYPVEAVLFLVGAYAAMAEKAGRDPADVDVRKIDVRMFCAGIGWEAVRHFGTPERAKEVLREWGIAGSEDLGRVLSVMWDVPAAQDDTGPFASDVLAVDQWF